MLTIVRYIKKAGGSARTEPRGLDPRTRKRVDIEAHLGTHRYLIDVKITHPTAKSNLRAALAPLGAARVSERMKSSHHGYLRPPGNPSPGKASRKAVFVPYIVESFGG